jgi:hypothetical protein
VNVFGILAAIALSLHLLWIAWVALGCLFTKRRPWLAGFHIVSLVCGLVVNLGPWPCPLTCVEQHLQRRAGLVPYRGGFMVHYLEALVYPDVPPSLLAAIASVVCLFNLGVYVGRWRRC